MDIQATDSFEEFGGGAVWASGVSYCVATGRRLLFSGLLQGWLRLLGADGGGGQFPRHR